MHNIAIENQIANRAPSNIKSNTMLPECFGTMETGTRNNLTLRATTEQGGSYRAAMAYIMTSRVYNNICAKSNICFRMQLQAPCHIRQYIRQVLLITIQMSRNIRILGHFFPASVDSIIHSLVGSALIRKSIAGHVGTLSLPFSKPFRRPITGATILYVMMHNYPITSLSHNRTDAPLQPLQGIISGGNNIKLHNRCGGSHYIRLATNDKRKPPEGMIPGSGGLVYGMILAYQAKTPTASEAQAIM